MYTVYLIFPVKRLNAQGSLLIYLAHVINPTTDYLSPEDIAAARANSNIGGSIKMIEAIKALSPSQLSDEAKNNVFKEMLIIASIYCLFVTPHVLN